MRWYDADAHWIPIPQDRERQLIERERTRVERLAEQLRTLGVKPNLDAEAE
ncbi:hypothetical protein H6F74_07960 [Trichocoleus sp. FACHB-90]|uniref:hypothetical protein n=1 Tax=Cyanophyceae TaxID=3028117 RepID=UPI00168518EB|nr:hypothetical protein [Trichocoleus sp. FACHB-90]MBD1926186.1 hypothetical protein [Trichocoleus sp. FACHB-90]